MNHHQGPTATDKQLVELVTGGDTRAFSRIIAATEGLVAQIVYRLVADEEDRKDAAQDIYLKVYHHLKGFRFQSKLSTWVGQIAYNTCLNRLDRRRQLIAVRPDALTDGPGEEVAGKVFRSSEESDRRLLRKELKDLIALEIGKLPPLYATLIALFHQQELSLQEIAEITDLPPGTIRAYLHRARKQLKETALSQYKKEIL